MCEQVIELRELASFVEEKDGYTADHCRRIQELSQRVGRVLQLDPLQQFHLYHGAYLHDLGKISVPDSVLQKPGPLTPEEWVIMKRHPNAGARMLAGSRAAGIARVLAQHHERLDGSGYPLGLKGDEICLEAQIVAVVDSYDAMTSDRVYRRGMSHDTAMDELRRGSGTLYSPDVIDALTLVLAEGDIEVAG